VYNSVLTARLCLDTKIQKACYALVHCVTKTRQPLTAAAWTHHRRPGLRSLSEMMKLEVPLTRTTFGNRSFAIDRPRVWNSLPASIRDPTLSITVF